MLTLNALTAASHLVVVTELSFLALQGIQELLETRDLVCAHYDPGLVLAGVVGNRGERTVEHRAGIAEIAVFFGPDRVWSPALPKRTHCCRARSDAAAPCASPEVASRANSSLTFGNLPTRAGRIVSASDLDS